MTPAYRPFPREPVVWAVLACWCLLTGAAMAFVSPWPMWRALAICAAAVLVYDVRASWMWIVVNEGARE